MSFWSRTARVAVSLVVLMLLMAILVELTSLGENKWMREPQLVNRSNPACDAAPTIEFVTHPPPFIFHQYP